MVAEAIPSTEIEQPKEEAVTPTPEVAEESPPEANQEADELDSIISTFVDGGDTAATDASTTSTDGDPADPYAGMTTAQIAEKVRQEEALKVTQQTTSAQRQAYLNGLANVVKNNPQRLDEMADRLGLMAEDRKAFKDTFNQLNGAYQELHQYDVNNALNTGVQNVTRGIHEGVTAALGKDVAEELMKANHQTWDAYLADVGERYAKTKGYVSKKERDAAVTEGQRRSIEKLATAMKERGFDIKQFTGEANPNVPPMRGGGAGQPKDRQEAELMHSGMHPSGRTITTAQMRNYLATGRI